MNYRIFIRYFDKICLIVLSCYISYDFYKISKHLELSFETTLIRQLIIMMNAVLLYIKFNLSSHKCFRVCKISRSKIKISLGTCNAHHNTHYEIWTCHTSNWTLFASIMSSYHNWYFTHPIYCVPLSKIFGFKFLCFTSRTIKYLIMMRFRTSMTLTRYIRIRLKMIG